MRTCIEDQLVIIADLKNKLSVLQSAPTSQKTPSQVDPEQRKKEQELDAANQKA